MRIHDPANESSWGSMPPIDLIKHLNQIAQTDAPGAEEIREWLAETGKDLSTIFDVPVSWESSTL